jgi:Tat protein translocase TatB subunit
MDIFGIGSPELIVILILAVIVLGPERMAKTAREIGKLVRNIKAYFASFSDELKSELDFLDEIKEVNNELQKR